MKGERTVPLRTLIQVATIWLVLDCVDINWLHWFSGVTPESAAHKFYWCVFIALVSYLIAGERGMS